MFTYINSLPSNNAKFLNPIHTQGLFKNLHFLKSNSIVASIEKELYQIPNYYRLLNVAVDADTNTIRKAYFNKSRFIHPDKKILYGNLNSEEENKYKCEEVKFCENSICSEIENQNETDFDINNNIIHSKINFNDLKHAYDILSDAQKRLEYDIEYKIVQDDLTVAMRSNHAILEMQEKADIYIEQIYDEYERKVEFELNRNGVVVVKALFGNLRCKKNIWTEFQLGNISIISENDIIGPCVDVTIAVQCMIEKSKLIFNGIDQGIKLQNLPGFYNPIPTKICNGKITVDAKYEPWLYILYQFKNKYHEITTRNFSSFSLPLRAHAVADNLIRGPMPDINVLNDIESDSDSMFDFDCQDTITY